MADQKICKTCDHYYQPKYDPAVVPRMNISRCIKCGYERWTHYDQVEEWKKNGLNGKQLMNQEPEAQS